MKRKLAKLWKVLDKGIVFNEKEERVLKLVGIKKLYDGRKMFMLKSFRGKMILMNLAEFSKYKKNF